MKILLHVIGIGILCLGFYLLGRHTATTTQIVEFNTRRWERFNDWERVERLSRVLGKWQPFIDSTVIRIDPSKPIGECELREIREVIYIPIAIDNTIDSIPVNFWLQYIEAARYRHSTNPMPYAIQHKVKVPKPSPVDFFLEGSVSYCTQKRLLTEIRTGGQVWKLFVCGRASVDNNFDGSAGVGLGIRL